MAKNKKEKKREPVKKEPLSPKGKAKNLQKTSFQKPFLKNKKNKSAKKPAKKIKSEKPSLAEKEEKFRADALEVKKVEVRVVGIGGGGGNIVSELSQRLAEFSSKKIDFVAANTDMQALKAVPKRVNSFAFGKEMTKGLGTGRNRFVGEAAAKKEEERIKNIFSPQKDLFILVSSLGGGTGTGATPVFAKIAHDLNSKTLGIFTLPFAFEGKDKLKSAREALEKIQSNLNAVLVLPNDKIFQLTKEETPFHTALSLLNRHIANSLEGLLRVIYIPGLINIDWADVKTILEGKSQTAYLNTAQVSASIPAFSKDSSLKEDKSAGEKSLADSKKEKRTLEDFAKALLISPILDYNFSQAENILFNIESSKNISLEQLMAISEKIHSTAPQAKIIFGLSQSPNLKDVIKATILATGSAEKKAKKAISGKKRTAKKINKKNKINKKESADAGDEKKEINTEEEDEKEIERKIKIRRNALEIKKAEREETEKEDEKDKIFEIPAFLRRGDADSGQPEE
ncbi:MAG: cell division protein FtsZ [Candidatus Paceibacterota bacterium]|jgi:cell division protein FtsZ|nr:cell division protein FtsZ [Candidatus Paceibacterota bacterium]MDD4831129.1 cell division protein FtsZ [Candidatus Paceibacterota bacterium]MDD4875107.1 cell division protein FtsZ [Candidatus Paceibacterota bacterium]